MVWDPEDVVPVEDHVVLAVVRPAVGPPLCEGVPDACPGVQSPASWGLWTQSPWRQGSTTEAVLPAGELKLLGGSFRPQFLS